PAVFREIAPEHQCLVRGEGASSLLYQVTAPGAAFVAARVRPGHVVHLANADQGVDGYYEVMSVEGETELLATLVGSPVDEWVPLPTATDLDFAIHTFDPQHEEARWALLARFGLEMDASDGAKDLERWILEHRSLRRASVARVRATVFRGQAVAAATDGALARKAEHYARLYEDEVAKVRLAVDRDADGRPDDVRSLGSHRLRRD
ncbi:MAG TPA: hypothetical protein VFH53_10590, partial [Phycisphaerae bacterium]|nr:hypothetical protein [Phycisphaerae bacterium]